MLDPKIKDYIKLLRGELDKQWRANLSLEIKLERTRKAIENFDPDDDDALMALIRAKQILDISPLIDARPVSAALDLVFNEHERQDHMFGVQDHSPEKWAVILSKEIGDFNLEILNNNLSGQLKQSVQIAAVALQIIQALLKQQQQHEA